MLINFKGISYHIKKLEGETDFLFKERCWYIVSMKPTNSEELNNAEKIAKLYSNSHNLGCRYNSKINNMINEFKPSSFPILK